MKRIALIISIFLFAVVSYGQVVEEQVANKVGLYETVHSDTVTADSTQIFQFYARVNKSCELLQGLDLTKSGTNVNCTVIRAYSFSGDTWTNLDTITVATTTVDAQAPFSTVDLDYPYYKITVDGATSAGIFPVTLYSVIKEKY